MRLSARGANRIKPRVCRQMHFSFRATMFLIDAQILQEVESRIHAESGVEPPSFASGEGSVVSGSSETNSSDELGFNVRMFFVAARLSVPPAAAWASTGGRSRRDDKPNSSRNVRLVPYRIGRPTSSARPGMAMRRRSSSDRSTSPHATPRIDST